MRNPDDTDNDGLPDSWENLYLNGLQYGKNDDPDNDGLINIFEYQRGTHPNATGIAGIINSITYQSYQNYSGVWVNQFSPSGTIYAHIELKSGTLDLKGKTLTIKGNLIQSGGTLNINNGTLIVTGNLIHSGGTLNINNGSLIVKGDYRSQTVGTDESGTPGLSHKKIY